MSELANGTRVRVVRDEPHSAYCKAGDVGEVAKRRKDFDCEFDNWRHVYDVRMTDGELWSLTEGEDFEVIP